MLLMAVWLQKKDNDKEHLFIVKNYPPLPLSVLACLKLFLSLFFVFLLPLLDFHLVFLVKAMHHTQPPIVSGDD